MIGSNGSQAQCLEESLILLVDATSDEEDLDEVHQFLRIPQRSQGWKPTQAVTYVEK